jgi:hypothetical protein
MTTLTCEEAYIWTQALLNWVMLKETRGSLGRAREPFVYLSLYLETGSTKGVPYSNWHRMSDAAELRRDSVKRDTFNKEVTFEHPRTIRDMYHMAWEERERLTAERLHEIVGEYPMIVVTKAENNSIPPNLKSSGLPEVRHANIKRSFPLRSDRWREYSFWPDS